MAHRRRTIAVFCLDVHLFVIAIWCFVLNPFVCRLVNSDTWTFTTSIMNVIFSNSDC
jgi:hypothetical protein